MKRPINIEGQIRYFGIGLAEVAATCYSKAIKFEFEIDTKPSIPMVYANFYDRSYKVELGSSNGILNQFEANLEAEMEVCND